MSTIYAISGTVALIEWVAAAVLFAVGWYATRKSLDRWGDGLAVAGLFTASVGMILLVWDRIVNLTLSQSSLATGFAVCLLVVYACFARSRPERLSALAVLGLAIPAQAYAVGQLWRGFQERAQLAFLPIWQALCILAGLLGYASLAVAALMIVLSFVLVRTADRLSDSQLFAARDLVSVAWWSIQVAMVALTLSLAAGLIRAWWGLGQVVAVDLRWALITWLLMSSGFYSLRQGALPRRLARGLLVLAALAGIAGVLAMGG
jgi:hypothetical protein